MPKKALPAKSPGKSAADPAAHLAASLHSPHLRPGARIGVAVSGGADSVALLLLLLELREKLGIVLSVVHFNHKLRGVESDEDEAFVAQLAREHKLAFHTASADVKEEAAAEGLSLEAAARELRYGFFQQLRRTGGAGHPPRWKGA